MPRTAVLSDIHGNLEALEQVLHDLDGRGVERVVVLGDTVGYGPNPRECLELAARRAQLLLIGNHEADLIQPDPDMDVDAELRAWTDEQLAGLPAWEALKERVTASGVEAAANRVEEEMHFVHGAPAAPVSQYIWPSHPCQHLVFNRQIGERLTGFLEQFERPLGICGHTHVPAVLTTYAQHDLFDPYQHQLEWNRHKSFISPQALFVVPVGSVTLDLRLGARLVLNPGSVGQPRDGCTEAAYLILDDWSFELRRVPYDRAPTLAKLAAMPIEQESREELLRRLDHGE